MSSLQCFGWPELGPRHQGVDVLFEVTVAQPGEEIAQVGVGLDAVHFAGADEAGKAGPVTPAFVVTGKERIATVHGRAADRVLGKRCASPVVSA